MAKIENDFLQLEVSCKGAEIVSLSDKKTGIEYMWQGDATYWQGRNPILFPIVGSTWDKKIHIGGKEFEMGNHGFVRSANFKEEKVSETHILLSYENNEETERVYPFQFKLWVEYTINKKKVFVKYRVENKSDCSMPFNFGLHPAFNCPLVSGESFNEYEIQFSNSETLSGICGPFGLNNQKTIPLSYELFEENETICFENPVSSKVSYTNGKHGVLIDTVGYRWLAFWTKRTGAPFLCIEPWHGHSDFNRVEVPFEKREGTQLLEPGKSFLTTLGIEIF